MEGTGAGGTAVKDVKIPKLNMVRSLISNAIHKPRVLAK